MAKIAFIAEALRDGTLWKPTEMLRAALYDTGNKKTVINKSKKAILIVVNEKPESSRDKLSWYQCGLTKTEMIDVLSLAKNEAMFSLIEENL